MFPAPITSTRASVVAGAAAISRRRGSGIPNRNPLVSSTRTRFPAASYRAEAARGSALVVRARRILVDVAMDLPAFSQQVVGVGADDSLGSSDVRLLHAI